MNKSMCFFMLVLCCINLMGESVVPQAPELNLISYLLLEPNSNTVLAEYNSEDKIYPASMTKVMSGYVFADLIAKGVIGLEDKVLISEKAWRTGGTKMFIEVGKTVSVKDLLSGMIIQSGNDATIAMAEHISGTEEKFVVLMNTYASNLGLNSSRFQNSTGFHDPNHFTSAKDLANLTTALIRDFPEYYMIFKEKEFTFNDIYQRSGNTLLRSDRSVDGVKSGFTTEAKYCLITSALRSDMRLISVVAGCPSKDQRDTASKELLEYGFKFFVTETIINGKETTQTAKVWGGKKNQVALGSVQDIFLTLPRSENKNKEVYYKLNKHIQAPIQKGDIIGNIEITVKDKVVLTSPLVALEEIKAQGFFGRIWSRLLFWITSLFSDS